MDFEFLIDDSPVTIKLEKKDGRFILSNEDTVLKIDMVRVSPHVLSFVIENRSYKIFIAEDRENRYFYLNGQHFTVKETGEKDKDFRGGEERSQEELLLIKAPMPGKVIKICVTEKENVRKNQTLAIVEAMKMENEIKSSLEGTVKKICAQPGDLVDSDKILIELESKESK